MFTLITYADENVAHYVPKLRRACEKLGYELKVYTPENTDIDQSILDLPNESELKYKGLSLSPQKPNVILQALDELQRPVIWMDTDAFPIASLDIDWEFDNAFTLRPRHDRGGTREMWDGLINAGVSLHNNTKEARELLQDIAKEVPNTKVKSDQEATSQVLVNRGWDKGYGDHKLGARVRILRTEEWNCYEFPNIQGARILHFKTPHKDKYDVYYSQLV